MIRQGARGETVAEGLREGGGEDAFSGPRANLITVTDDPQEDENRKDRDRERSDEAHWRVAEEGADDQDDGPKQKTEKGQEETRTPDS